jgi:ATP-binding cassette subfamily C protein CydCD
MSSPTIQSARPYFFRFFSASLLGATSLAMAVGLLASSAWLISMAATQPPVLTLQVAVVSVRFFGISRGFFRYAERIWSHDAILRSATSLQLTIYRALINRQPVSSNDDRQGKILQQLTTDIEVVQDRWIRLAIPFFGALISGWAGIGIISWLAPNIGLINLLLFTLAIILIPFLAGKNSLNHSGAIFDSETAIADQVANTCRSHLEADIYGYQEQLRDELKTEELKIINQERKLISNSGIGGSLLLALTFIAVVVSFLMALEDFALGELAGVNIAVVTLLPLAIFDGIPMLIAPLALAGKIRRATNNIDQLINSTNPKSSVASLEPGETLVKFVNARAIWADQTLSHNPITATVRKNEPILIKGESGIGKTSLALALTGLINYEGSIRINGIEVRDIHESNLQQTMTVLLQDEQLFASSIRENLKIAKPDASDDELLAALKEVELIELINSLPEGLDTHIGAFGTNFSGGEKQRFRLARIFLRVTPLYLLDEPLEHLEKEQAARIYQRIKRYCQGKTLILISHQAIDEIPVIKLN